METEDKGGFLRSARVLIIALVVIIIVPGLALVLLILVGVLGFLLHINTSLIPRGTIVVERFVRGSPLLAPLLFANVGLLGLLVLLDPRERTTHI